MNNLSRTAFALFTITVAAGFAGSTRAQTRTPVPPPTQHGYLYLPGIPGAVTTSGYTRWHAVDGYRLEAETVTRGRLVSRTFSPVSVGADLGVALPLLVVKCASGQRLPYAILRMFRPRESRYFVELRMYGVSVLSVSANELANGGSGQSIELDYTRIVMTQVDTKTGRRTSRSIDRRSTPFSRGKSAPVAASPSNDYQVFVRIDQIPGSSARRGYAGWHEVDGYDVGVRRTGTVPAFSPLRLSASQLSALPELTMAALSGQPIRNVEVHVWSSAVATGPVLVMTLANVLVRKAGSTATATATSQSVELSYGSVQFEYFKEGRGSSEGSVRGGWNLRTNAAQ